MKIKGYLLYSPATHNYFFRVYDPHDRSKFVDYDLCVEDMEIVIIDRFVELKQGDHNRIDYTDKVLGKN